MPGRGAIPPICGGADPRPIIGAPGPPVGGAIGRIGPAGPAACPCGGAPGRPMGGAPVGGPPLGRIGGRAPGGPEGAPPLAGPRQTRSGAPVAPAAHHTLPERIYYPAPVGVDALLLPAALLPVASSPRQTGLEGPKSTLAASVRLIHCRSPVGLAVHRHSVHRHSVHRQQCGSSSDRPASPAPDKTRRSADLHAARTAPVIHQCATYGPIDGPKRREARGGEPRSINDQRPVIPAVRASCRDGATSARTNTSISPI